MSSKYDKSLRIIWTEIEKMAQNIPEALPLEKLIELPNPSLSMRSGEKVIIDPEEIRDLSSLIPEMFWGEIRLPLVFLKKKDHFELLGSKKIIFWLIEKILFPNQKIITPYLVKKAYTPHRTYFYSYHIQKLRKRFPSLIYVLFYGSKSNL
ncbi:MAG: DUF61 family protein [Candidatus Hodarchaeota archaeon]